MIFAQTLKEIDLGRNDIGEFGAQSLAHVLENKNVFIFIY